MRRFPALAANPVGGGPEMSGQLLDAILEEYRRWLPRFVPDG